MSAVFIYGRRMSHRFFWSMGFFALIASFGVSAHAAAPVNQSVMQKPIAPLITPPPRVVNVPMPVPGYAAAYLDSHFAQSQNDWRQASAYLDKLLKSDPQNPDLLRRSMILAMGAGDLSTAAARAQSLVKTDKSDGLAMLILALDDFAHDRTKDVLTVLSQMPDGDVTTFVRPLLRSWAEAAQGKLDPENLNLTTVHFYAGGLISLYLNDKLQAAAFAKHIIDSGAISPYDAERAGDLLAASGQTAAAIKVYQGIIAQEGSSHTLALKLTAVQKGGDLHSLIPALQIKSPKQGAAVAIFDLARILYQEQSDGTARLFANMALALNPNMVEAQLLLANALARADQPAAALGYFTAIKPSDPNYLDIEHYVADLEVQAGRKADALKLLNQLFDQQHDIDALVRMGDIYRTDEDYKSALREYDRAVQQLGGKVPDAYWYVLYARGMTYERAGDWPKAEKDLLAALAYRPDNPYLMNYLAYGWAEQGQHIPEALKLIQRAATLRPTDGYIAGFVGVDFIH